MLPSTKSIGVIGAGQMGNGIAHIAALSGYRVVLLDLNETALERALNSIVSNLSRQVKKGSISDTDKEYALGRIQLTTRYEDLSSTRLVIEAATENETIKKEIFANVIEYVDEDTIIASNTSSISITRLAASTDRPEKFIGMHFMNPVPVMQLVEIIRGIGTNEATFLAVQKVVEDLNKTPVTSEDFPAFIVNRILLPMINEAVYTLYEGVGGVASIDTAMRLGANHPMGPLQLADFIGLDTCLAIMNILHEGLADTKYRPCPLLVKYVEAGWLGKKTGRGFYDYQTIPPKPTR